MSENEQPQINPLPTNENPVTEQPKNSASSNNFIIGIAIAVVVIVAITALLLFSNKQSGSDRQVIVEQEAQKEIEEADNMVELKITQGETLSIPGTDVKIKAVRISETCTHVPPPSCGDEATLEFSHFELSSTYAFTLRRPSQAPSEKTYMFFGHKVTVKEVRGTQATLIVEIQEEIPGDISGWLVGKNSKAGFELQHPRIFEFEDKGEITPAPQLYYNHWLIIRAPGQEFPELLTVLIYNNISQSLNEFANAHIFPNDSAPKNSVIGSKEIMESLHIGLDGETKNYFWLDTAKKRGAIFSINPAKSENLSDFHKIIGSFKFTQ